MKFYFQALNQFLDKFSERNPISQVGIVVCKDKRAERLIPLTGTKILPDFLHKENVKICYICMYCFR